jgi:hypothetical protein
MGIHKPISYLYIMCDFTIGGTLRPWTGPAGIWFLLPTARNEFMDVMPD